MLCRILVPLPTKYTVPLLAICVTLILVAEDVTDANANDYNNKIMMMTRIRGRRPRRRDADDVVDANSM